MKVGDWFPQFIQTADSPGEGLSNVLLSVLERLRDPLETCSQGHNNGANKKGKEQG
ncbi:hypothetical protein QYM36_000785, partial [Artemia franciscana]